MTIADPTAPKDGFFRVLDKEIHKDHAKDWHASFVRCWSGYRAKKSEESHLKKERVKNKEQLSKQILTRHQTWTEDIYYRHLRDENFSIPDIYVPLKIIESHSGARRVEDLTVVSPHELGQIVSMPRDATNEPAWMFIKGAPGSGKSVQAICIAYEIRQQGNCEVLFCRLGDIPINKVLKSLDL